MIVKGPNSRGILIANNIHTQREKGNEEINVSRNSDEWDEKTR